MMIFKSCPRCRGDMYRDRDIYGEYVECLQCGHVVNLDKNRMPVVAEVMAEAKREAA